MTERGELAPWSAPVPLTQAELLTEEFYAWERRGRGWQVWGYPVELEPPFRPFFFHHARPVGPGLDDARKPTLVGGLVERAWDWISGGRGSSALALETELEEPAPDPFSEALPLVEVQVSIPPDLKITRDAAEQFLLSLPYAGRLTSFEVIGEQHCITVQVVCREGDVRELRQQLRAHFPEAVLAEELGFLARRWGRDGAGETVVVDFGLSREFMLPLRTVRGFEVDPLIGVAGALAELQEGETAVLQLLFQPVRHPWAESLLRAVRDWEGGSFFADAPEMVPLAREKISRPLFAAVVRVAARSPAYGRAWEIARALGGALRQFGSPRDNELAPLANDGYEEGDHEEDFLLRHTRRSGMILNSEELVSLVHLPSASVRAEKLKRQEKKTKAAPATATGHQLVLGENAHAGKVTRVTLGPEQRVRHTYVIGASGTGKSTLLLNLIIQDIRNGVGVGVLDPHGDLIDRVLGYVPEERFQDVVLLDPADAEYPVGFNILQAHSELEKNLMASDLVAVFRRLSTSWGDQMTSVLGNALLAFLESGRGGTLADLRRFLVEPDFRRAFLPTVRDPEVVYYWQREFPLLGGKPQAPLLTRLDTFLRPKLVRHMVSQKENRLDFRAMMDQGKIFLGKLAQGAVGEENAYLLGTLLVSKFQQIAMSRQEIEEAGRRPFYLYIDEFHNFITPSMGAILSGARKYGLGLTLAHQDLRQLGKDPDTFGAVMSNPYTRISFRVGDQDAKKLEDGFSNFKAVDLQNLGTGEAVCRMERAEHDFNLKTPPLPGVDLVVARARRERVIALSRERYATPRAEVEAMLRREQPEAPVAEPLPQPEGEKRSKARAVPAAPMPGPVTTPPVGEALPSLPKAPPSPGRGGQEHKYLQSFIKQAAESRGYRAVIEKQILGGAGSVDVALEKGGNSVACEISVSSTPEQELGNVKKCLQSEFELVLVISSERKALARIEKLVFKNLSETELTRVRFLAQEEIVQLLDELDARAASTEETVRGLKVKTRYLPIREQERKTRQQAISKVLFDSWRRLRGKPD